MIHASLELKVSMDQAISLLQRGRSFVEYRCRLPVEEELIGRSKLLVTRKWIVSKYSTLT